MRFSFGIVALWQRTSARFLTSVSSSQRSPKPGWILGKKRGKKLGEKDGRERKGKKRGTERGGK